MAKTPDIPNIPGGNLPPSIPNGTPIVPNGAPPIPSSAPSIPGGVPNIPSSNAGVSHLNDIDALMLQRKEEKRKAEEEAKRKAEAEAKRKAAAEAKRKAEEEKKRKENMPKAKELYDKGKAKTKGFFSANYKEARALFEESLALGYGDAAYEIAEMYKLGIGGCEKNLQEYLRLIDRGIELHSSYTAE